MSAGSRRKRTSIISRLALASVASRRPDVRILFVGDGPSRRSLEGRIGAVAHFAGYRQGADLADHYAAGDLFAFASLTETLGNVVLEAMSSGLPVVALKAGGVSETVQSGRLESCWTPASRPIASPRRSLWLDRAVRRTAEDERGRAGVRNHPELGSHHGLAAGPLPEHHRRVPSVPSS